MNSTLTPNKKIAITGCSGMVGFYVLREAIQRGYSDIRVLLRANSRTEMIESLGAESKYRIIRLNFNEEEELEAAISDCDMLIHCAALINASLGDIHYSNIKLTAQIVNAALNQKLKKLVYISSVAALNRWSKGVTDERISEINRDQASNYAYSKYLAEMEVWRGIAEGLNSVIINASQVMGLSYSDNPNTRLWRRIAEIRHYYPLGSLGLVDVRDLARAVCNALEIEMNPGRIILNSGHLTYRDFFNKFRSKMNLAPLPKPLPMFLHLYGAPLFRIFYAMKGKWNNPYNKKYLRQLMEHFEYSNLKSKELLNMDYRPIEETLEAIAAELQESADKSYYVLS